MTLHEKAQHFKPYELECILDEICADDLVGMNWWWNWWRRKFGCCGSSL